MTTQRERLAAVLHDVGQVKEKWSYAEWANELMSRGVRVVDVDTLGAAVHATQCYGNHREGTACRGPVRARQLIAALDGKNVL